MKTYIDGLRAAREIVDIFTRDKKEFNAETIWRLEEEGDPFCNLLGWRWSDSTLRFARRCLLNRLTRAITEAEKDE